MVMLALAEKGLAREEAYALVQKNAMKSWKGKKDFKQLLLKDANVKRLLTEKEIERIFSMKHYLKNVDYLFQRVFGK